jgi:hypothetical protein
MDYEHKRRENIQKNLQLLKSLGLGDPKVCTHVTNKGDTSHLVSTQENLFSKRPKAVPSTNKKPRPYVRKKTPSSPPPLRKSQRFADKPKPVYLEEEQGIIHNSPKRKGGTPIEEKRISSRLRTKVADLIAWKSQLIRSLGSTIPNNTIWKPNC